MIRIGTPNGKSIQNLSADTDDNANVYKIQVRLGPGAYLREKNSAYGKHWYCAPVQTYDSHLSDKSTKKYQSLAPHPLQVAPPALWYSITTRD